MALPLTKEKASYIICILLVLNIYFAFIDEFYSIDLCYIAKPDKSESAHILDKHMQAIFFSTYFIAFMSIPFPKEGFNGIGKRFFEFFISHAFRYIIYILFVNPVGDFLPYNACLTRKSISGHTHMYGYHIGLIFYMFCMYLTNANKEDKSGRSKCFWLVNNIFSIGATIIFIFTLITGIISMNKTYYGGYHSPRHMIQGLITAIETIFLYILFRKMVLVKVDWMVEKLDGSDFLIE